MFVKPSVGLLLAYVLVGGFCVYLFLHGVLSLHPELLPQALILLNRPATVLVLVGTIGSRPITAVFWGLGGFLAGEISTVTSSLVVGVPVNFGYGPLVTLAFYSAVFIGLTFIQRAQRGRVPDFLRLRQESQRLEAERTFEQRAVALVHDTVLNDLALVINGPDELSDDFRDRLLDDVSTLSRAQIVDGSERRDLVDESDAALRNQLLLLVTEFQWRGLNVDITGDTGTVAHISAEARHAAVGALRACLENVLRHSGQNRAEIIVSATETWVTWTVSDDGVGFDPKAVASDRLGLRASVVQRVEAADGTVRIFSAPGSGASVLITLPLLGAPDA
jgi:signal transduction histidine kinase